MHAVKCLVAGRWWDSVKEKIIDAKKGETVKFSDRRDAEHFVNDGRAEWHSGDEDADEPKKPRGKKDAEAAAAEQGDAD